MANSKALSKRLNVLVLDGGGVRGLSSLLILQALMVRINQILTSLGATFGERHPHHIFQLVAGTSTGGLIALMLGKMGMTVDECIKKYEELSKVIFGKKHLRGRMTHGLAPARYSGKRLQKCIRTLLRERELDENLSMRHEADRDRAACAVICREHCSSSQYSKLRHSAVPICSLPCTDNLVCTVCDAARATSAAPTFFPVMKIKDRFFADGGLGNNNPSFAIFFHYMGDQRKKSTRPMTASGALAPRFSPHGHLDCTRSRFTNIGTGAKAEEVEPGKRDRLAGLLPGFIRRGVFLKQTLTEIATNSEGQVYVMRQFEELSPNTIMYERFDANHGVSNIKLDDHKALDKIREKTKRYLEEQGTKDLLDKVGKDIANDYWEIHGQNMQPADPAIDKSRQSIEVSTVMPGSSLSSGPSSHSDSPDRESYVLFPEHDTLQNGGPAPLAEHPADNALPSDGQEISGHYVNGNSGVDAVKPETPMRKQSAGISLQSDESKRSRHFVHEDSGIVIEPETPTPNRSAGISLQSGESERSRHFVHEDSGIDTIEPGTPVVAASA